MLFDDHDGVAAARTSPVAPPHVSVAAMRRRRGHSGAWLPDKLRHPARAQCPLGGACLTAILRRRPALNDERASRRYRVSDGLILSYSGELYHASALSTLGNSRIETRLAGGAPSTLSVRPPAADSDPHTAPVSRRHGRRSRSCICRGRGRLLLQRNRQGRQRYSAHVVRRPLKHRSRCHPARRAFLGI